MGTSLEPAVGPQRVPHLARHLAVAAADGVGSAAHAQRRLGHAERGLGLGADIVAEGEQLLGGEAQLAGQAADGVLDLARRVGVVARGHGRVGGEDGAGPGAIQRLGQRDAVGLAVAAGQLQRGQGGVALVEVDHPGLVAHRPQRPDPPDAEQRVLGQPGLGIAVIEAAGDPAVHGVVVATVGVEQEQRDPPDVDAPDTGGDVACADRDADRQRRRVRAGDERRREAIGVGVDPVLVLPARGVDALAEVALAVHEPDGDERHRPVRGLLEQVAGQRAQPAGVHRQRHVHAVFGAQEAHGMGRVQRRAGVGPVQVGGDLALQRLGAGHQLAVLGGAPQHPRRGLLQQPHRVAPAQVEAL